MVVWYVYLALGVSVAVSFWMSLVEATFLTVRPLSLTTESSGGNSGATRAIKIVEREDQAGQLDDPHLHLL